MNKTIGILGGLLAAQLLLALWVLSGDSDLSAQGAEGALLDFDPAAVTGIAIAGAEEAGVVLSKGDAGWTLPEAWDAPANSEKVKQLLQRLKGLEKGLAVATTAGARSRFEVTEEKFQRRITLNAGDKELGIIYLGTSPAMRKVHVRTADADPVYTVSLSAFEVPAKADDWLDSGLVQIPQSELESIELENLTLSRSKAEEGALSWETKDLAEGEQLDQAKAAELARKIAGLQVRGVLGTEADPKYRQETPELVLTLQRNGGKAVTWTLSKPEQGEEYVLKASEHPWYFGVAAWAAKPITETGRRSALMIVPETSASEPVPGPAPGPAAAAPEAPSVAREPQSGAQGATAVTPDPEGRQLGAQEAVGAASDVREPQANSGHTAEVAPVAGKSQPDTPDGEGDPQAAQ